MKSSKKIIICLVAALSLSFISLKNTMALNFGSTCLKLASEAIWYIAKSTSSQLYEKTPTIKTGFNWVLSSTGTIKFNRGTTGASATVYVNLSSSNMSLEVYGETDPLNQFDKIAVIARDPKGNKVISKSIGRNQLAYYGSKAPYGKYTIDFVEEGKNTWNCFFRVIDFNVKRNPNYRSVIISDSGQILNHVVSDDNIYIIPSNQHENDNSVESKYLSIDELSDQFYDENLKLFVNSMKDFNAGDNIYFKDRIDNIFYNETDDSTSFEFKKQNNEERILWKFKGDLTNQYNINDDISLYFKVVNEQVDSKEVFENIDYFVDAANLGENQYPDINRYLDVNK